MLNDNIRIDLHIHSKSSEYKEMNGYVDESNIDNVDILLSKLEENDINLISITDHNRFDYQLYDKIKSLIGKEPYNKVKNILPGIEFDVNLEDNSTTSCHIVCIFDDEKSDRIKEISDAIKRIRELTDPNDAYSIEEFEKVLYEIGLNVVLIAHQKSGLDTPVGSKTHHSLSESTSNPGEWIKTGYINALEYQTPRVQGILKNNLREIKEKFATITGSDCHVWSAYPKKDFSQGECNNYVTKIKSLPTFKGLVMALSSPDTRFDRKNEGISNDYIESIKINGEKYELSTGINAIIGENGSGKTFILNKLKDIKDPKYRIIDKSNEIKVTKTGNPEILIIKQGEIIEKVKEGKLLDNNSDFYDEIATVEEFKENIKNYVENLKKYINNKIKENEKENNINEMKIQIKDFIEVKNYYVSLNVDTDIIDNIPAKRKASLNSQYKKLLQEYNNNKAYYIAEKKTIMESVLTALQELMDIIQREAEKVENNNKITNVVISVFKEKDIEFSKERTSQEKEKEDYILEIRNFASEIKKYLDSKELKNDYPVFPKEIDGASVKCKDGFMFIKEAKYNNLNLQNPLYKSLFTQAYQNPERIKTIVNKDMFAKAVSGITSVDMIETGLEQNVQKFIEEYTKEETRIRKENGSADIGTTPGEVALTFYELTLLGNSNCDVILIDQPEDDISMKRIEKYMLEFFNRVRDKKQVIFVTHNPLLVVNLDVDNIIYLSKNRGNKIEVQSGCLESSNLIEIVSQSLDGGKEAIERRLKVYGNS